MIVQTELHTRAAAGTGTTALSAAAPSIAGTLRRLAARWWASWVRYASATYPWR